MDEFEMELRIGELENELDQLRQENDSLRNEILNKSMHGKYQQKTFIPVRYQLITIYNDNTSKTESHNNAAALISAASIYLLDCDCEAVEIWDFKTGEYILNYWRD